MKALKFFLLFALAVILHGCAQDDFETYTTDAEKIALYKAKAKEFAEKYHVQMAIREECLREIIKTKTIEDIENDFLAFSQTKYVVTIDSPNKSHLKIKKKISLEEPSNIYTGSFSGNITARAAILGANRYVRINGTFIFSWKHNVSSPSYADISINPYDITDTLSARISPILISKQGNNYSFNIDDVVDFEFGMYTLRLRCIVVYDDARNKKELILSSV